MIYVPEEIFCSFRNGITTSKHMEDAYWDRGLGYFLMTHKGI